MRRARRTLLLAAASASLTPAVAHAGSFDLVGHAPLGARGMNSALAMHGDHAYIGSRSDGPPPKGGIAVVDVSNPRAPRQVHTIGPPGEGASGLSSRELRVWREGGLLVVLRFACEAPQTCLDYGAPASYAFYDIRGDRAARPELVGTYRPSRVPHEFFLWEDPLRRGRALLYMSTLTAGGGEDLLVTDISRAREGVFDELASWSAGYGNPDGSEVDLHSLSVSADGRRGFLAHLGAGYLEIDTSEFADARPHPRVRLRTPLERRVEWGLPGAHSAVPLPGRPHALVTDEVYGGTLGVAPALGVSVAIGCPWGWARLIDTSARTRPAVEGEYRVLPYNDARYCTPERRLQSEQATFSSHNPTVTHDLALVTWHSAGLQAIDVSDPARPRQAAEFRPPPLPAVVTEDPTFSTGPDKLVFWSYPVIRDGLIYVADVRNGLYVVRYRGAFAGQLSCAELLEGNSNVANGRSPCPLAVRGGNVRIGSRGRVGLVLECSTREEDGCTGTVRLERDGRTVGDSEYALGAHETLTVPVRLNRLTRRRLERARRLRLGAVAVTAVPGADAERATAAVTVYSRRARMPRPAASPASAAARARPRQRRLPQQPPPSARQLRRSGLVCLLPPRQV